MSLIVESLVGAQAEPSTPIHAVTPETLQPYLDSAPKGAVDWVEQSGFVADAGTILAVPGDGGERTILFGLGSDARPNPLLPGELGTKLPAGTYKLDGGFDDPAMVALAFALGAYRFDRYRKGKPSPRLMLPDGIDADRVKRIAEGVTLARDLINTPANDMGPADLAGVAEDLAKQHGADFRIIDGDDLVRGFPLIHAVGAAAEASRAPRLIELNWGEPSRPKVTLVGKGVCFDTGGLDIKPAAGMVLMKKDMGGAANVLGLAHMIMAGSLPVRLQVLIPAVENAISGAAFRPGDILTSRKGISVEIGNTDAEGRLVLADALDYAAESDPVLLVDLATLTGAARVALGPDVAPFFTRDEALAADLAAQSAATADPVWRLPLWQPYAKLIASKVADINNVGSTPFAGSITAALFLSRFVAESTAWIHGDIYGWTPAAKPAKPVGGEAQAIRALYGLLEARYGT